MAVAPSSIAVQCMSRAPHAHTHTAAFQSVPITSLPLHLQQRNPLFCSALLSSRARTAIAASSSKKNSKNKKKLSRDHVTKGDDEDEEEDALEMLFKQLEQDLKNDKDGGDGDGDGDFDEITEEDLALLERELEDALGDFDAETLNPDVNVADSGGANDPEDDDDGGGGGGDDDEDERLPKLRTWQLKKLARALKAGRRKISIKNLAAELCLDRALVLELLREPPPNLLMMSLSLPDEPKATVTPLETKPIETVREEIGMDCEESGPNVNAKVPVHVMQRRWSAQKRLKKAQVDTLEKVYRRSKRPTNAMISSIVHVTNIPRRRVVKWFEDKRAEEGVPEHRVPYQRPLSETA